MANTITIQDIPKADKNRYYKFVRAPCFVRRLTVS